MTENGGIRALERGLTVLDHISRMEDPVGITDLAASTKLAKATVHRILQTLAAKRVVIQGEDGRYAIGPAPLTWADAFQTGAVLPRLARPIIKRLWESTQETVHLTAYDGQLAYYVDKMESPHPVRMRSRIGARLRLHTTAAGRSILAALSPERLREALSGIDFSASALVSSESLLRDLLDRVRARGYASEKEENEPGIRCVGAAVLRGKDRSPMGAISVSIPAYRLSDNQVPALGEAVRDAAREVSDLMDTLKKGGLQP